MEKDLVGFRFHPTGEELINHYLKNKILGKPWLVDDAISEINICSYDPYLLPSMSKLDTKDPVWYFFSPREYTTSKKTAAKRTTPSGFWKSTGRDRKIIDKRGNGVEIGIKKTLVYRHGRGPNDVSTPWVIHEYHITCLPLDQYQRTYVICQVMYKGAEGDVLLGNNSNEPSYSFLSHPNTARAINTSPEVNQPVEGNLYGVSLDDLVSPMIEQGEPSPDGGFDPNTFFSGSNIHDNRRVQPETPGDDEYWRELLSYDGGEFEDVFSNPELILQTNHNRHGPKKPLSGTIDYCNSDNDSDAETISGMSYQGVSSPGDSVGSLNRDFPSCSSTDSFPDLQISVNPSTIRKNRESQLTNRTILSTQEVLKVKEGRSKSADASTYKKLPSSMVKTEKKGWFVTEEAVKRNGKNPPYIYLTNMTVGLILLLALISDIMSVLVSVKS